ncbi:MAG: hypothetical protein K2G44_05055 [Clostridia bacterium]|nr:hypothetical protein [Clostridia bacterium]
MKERLQKLFHNRTFRIVLICVAALLLLLAVWRIFFPSKAQSTSGSYKPTELESRLSQILSEIDGVGQTTVMIGEENGVPVSAIIVFDGADAILTRMRVIEAAANALGIPQTDVLVYPSV